MIEGKHKGRIRILPISAGLAFEKKIELCHTVPDICTIQNHDIYLFTGKQHSDDRTARKFRYDGNHRTSELEMWIDDYFNHKLILEIKSELLPSGEAQYTGAVRNLVGTTFLDSVTNLEKDVLVNIFAPWCGYSQKFKPEYQKLAQMLKHVKTIELTQIDGTQNECEGHPVDAFPTVLFFPAGKKKKNVITYNDHRTVKALLQFVKKHAYFKFDEIPPRTLAPPDSESGLLGSEDDL